MSSRIALARYKATHQMCEVSTCLRAGMPDPHHIKSQGSGGSDDPENLITLCFEHHNECHKLGRVQFPEKYDLVDRWEAAFNHERKKRIEKAQSLGAKQGMPRLFHDRQIPPQRLTYTHTQQIKTVREARDAIRQVQAHVIKESNDERTSNALQGASQVLEQLLHSLRTGLRTVT